MQQTELFPVPNPCVGICQSNTKGYCMGCLRSRTERQKWNDFMPVEKMRVIELCDLRKAKLAEAMKAKQEREALIAKGDTPKGPQKAQSPDIKKSVQGPLPDSVADEGSLNLF